MAGPLVGSSDSGWAVWGGTINGTGVAGTAGSGTGTYGDSVDAYGVFGRSTNAVAVVGDTANQYSAVWGHNRGSGIGVMGSGDGGGSGVAGASVNGPGVTGSSQAGHGVLGYTNSRTAVGVYGTGPSHAGWFHGHVTVRGNFSVVNGTKNFKIDHPLDPQNKYLLHNAVESSEMKNVYDGVALLDADGAASVDLPEWFEALNGDFRYQLTAIGGAAPNLHVAEEISESRFKIAGGEGGMKVCWQVTGSRKDPWAAANPFEVEQEKPEDERGLYLQPDLYYAPEEQSVKPPSFEIPEKPPDKSPSPSPPRVPAGEQPMPPSIEPSQPAEMRPEQGYPRQIDELRRQIEANRRAEAAAVRQLREPAEAT